MPIVRRDGSASSRGTAGIPIDITLTRAEVNPFIPASLIGTGRTETNYNPRRRLIPLTGNFTTSMLIRAFRPQDVSAEGVITGRPYYGVVTTANRPASNHFGAITPVAIVPSDWRDDNPFSNYYGPTVATFRSVAEPDTNPTTYTNTLYTTGTAFSFSFIAGPGLIRAWLTGGNNRTAGKYWSANPCQGTWTMIADLSFRYQTISNTGLIRTHTFSVRTSGNIVVDDVTAGRPTYPCPGDPPAAPTVTASMITATTALISWNRTGVVNYWQWSTDDETWTRVPGDGNTTSVAVTGLTPNTATTIYIRGVAPRGNTLSGSTSFRTLVGGPLPTTVPTPTVSSSNVGEVSATINWVAGTGGLAVAKWQWSTDNSTWTDVPGGAVPTSLDVENLTPGTGYTYYIRGVSSGGVNSDAGSTSFTTASLPLSPDEPVVAGEVQRSLVGTPGGGSLKTTDRPPAFVVRSNRPSVVWDTSPFIVSPTNIYPDASLPGTEDNRGYADEFDPLPLKWSFFPAPASSAAQASVRVLLNVYDAAGNSIDAGQRTLQLVNNVASFTSTATRVASELSQFDVAGNTAGTQAASQGAPNGWGATPAGDSVGFARIGLQLSALDNASPAASSNTALMEFIPYQGLRLGDISTYNAGAGLVGFECHYYARGITATTQARNNEVAFYKWAIYRRNAAENERPVAGTIREAGQTLTATGAHWVPTGWSMGYRQHAWQTARGQVALVKTGLRNPDTTRLRIAFPSAETTGLLPNGNYTVRLRVIDIYGNQVGPVSHDFVVNRAGGTTTPVSTTLPPGSDAQTIAVVPVPRVYTADGTLTTTANTGLADVTTGLVPGQSIGLSVNVVGTVPSRDDLRDVVGSEGEVVNILVIQRREFSRVSGRDVDRSPRIVSGRIFINTIGGSAGAFFPTFRVLNDDGGVDAIFFDHQLESGVEYQYRCVWINKFSNRSYSTWVPA